MNPLCVTVCSLALLLSLSVSLAQSSATVQDKLSQVTTDTAQVRLLADRAVQLGNNGQGDRALQTIRQSMALARQINATVQHAYLYYSLGRVHRYRSEFPASVRAYQTAIRLCETTASEPLLRKAKYALAVVLTDQGDYPAANQQTIDNLTQIRSENDPDTEVANLSLLAVLYQFQKNTAGHIACANQILAIGQRMANDEYNVRGYSTRANAERQRKNYSRVLTNRRRSIALLRRMPDSRDYLLSELLDYAQDLRLANLPNDVWPVLYEARHLAEQQRVTSALSACWSEYSQAYLNRNNAKAALQSVQLAVKYARQSKRPRLLLEALDVEIQINKGLSDYRSTYKALRQYTHLKDSLNTTTSQLTIARLQARLDRQRDQDSLQHLRQRLTVAHLRAAQREQDFQIQQQRQLLFWTVIGGLLLLMAGAVFFLIQIRKAQRLLQQKNKEIEHKAAQVNQLNAEKDRLFSIIGHDLRAPVTRLKQQLDQLRFATVPTGEWQPQITQLARNADQLFTLTNNLLYWSLMQQNGLLSHPVDLLLMDVLSDTLMQLDGLLSEKHLLIRYQTPSQQPAVRADEQQTAIVIRNILHNAIKFSPVGAEISVAVHVRAGQVHLLITDAGPGFAQTIRETPFGQHGTGLGLQLVRDLMRASGGEFQISNATDGGAVVRLIWSLARVTQNTALPVSLGSN